MKPKKRKAKKKKYSYYSPELDGKLLGKTISHITIANGETLTVDYTITIKAGD